ncbi:NUDIX hydrolase [Microbacterium mangrovi]|uniref:NUDIX hydrolase n=1 Tax=Microbacterium mangrovi TaxID=1348253 RepID=A0A0B2AE09_9MICO|nr:NUDIX domain-containing protein [Microbacterium mangrovi]KHK99955.1 NUDIX hydrolase [Microbacterium mangrovi]
MTETIRVSAVVFRDPDGRVLTVRKRGTSRFMFPGGKPEPGEDAATAAVRECAEELGVVLDAGALRSLGSFTADAANEPGHRVVADVFEHPYIAIDLGAPQAEIAELAWMSLDEEHDGIAPLLRDAVFPALRAGVSAAPAAG